MEQDLGVAVPARATHEPSRFVSALRVGIANAAAFFLVACDTGQPPAPIETPAAVQPVAAQAVEAIASLEPAPTPEPPAEYAGRNRVEIDNHVYRICDGESGRMIFVYRDDGYRTLAGGVFVLTGQGECR